MVSTLAVPTVTDTTAATSPPVDNVLPMQPPATPAPAEIDVDAMADEAVKAVISDAAKPPAPSMQQSVALAIKTNPDAEAEARRVAARTGVPVQTVFAQPDEMKRKAALDDINFDTYSKMYPSSALALSDIELAKIAHDDTENMGYTENILRGIGARTINVGAGLARVGYAVDKAALSYVAPDLVAYSDDMVGLPGTQLLQEAEKATLGYTPRTTWEDVKNRPLAEFLPFALEQGLVSAPDMVAAVFVPEAYFAALTGQFGQNRAENDGRKEATLGDFLAVAPGAAVNALLERFATKGIIGAGQARVGLKELGKAALVAAAKEGSTEAIQNAAQYASETVGTKKGFDIKEAGEQALQGVVAGAPFGGGVRIASEGVKATTERFTDRMKQATVAEQNGRDFDELNKLAAESKLKMRDPLAFQNFIEQVAQTDGAIENVYIDPRALAQAGVSLEELAKASPSIAEQARVALEVGGDVKIPVSEYASHLAGTELGQAMVEHLKTNPLGMSRAEAREFMQGHAEQLKADVEKTMTESQVDEKVQQSADVVREDLMKKLTETNRFTADVNQQYSAMLANFYKVQAARIGATPEELYARHPVNIQSILDTGETLNQEGQTPQFYSALNKNISDMQQGKGSADQWAGIIKNLTNKGVKQEEIDWSGVQGWLAQQKGTVTKEQVLAYLKAHQINIGETVKGEDVEPAESPYYVSQNDEGEWDVVDQNTGAVFSTEATEEDAQAWIDDEMMGVDPITDTKFEKYTLPGGREYRELVLTLPDGKARSNQLDEAYNEATSEAAKSRGGSFSIKELLAKSAEQLNEPEKRAVELWREMHGPEPITDEFNTQHFEESNIVAHLRFNDRTDADGKKVMFIEEIQSDWHQAGRKKGYKTPEAVANLTKLREEYHAHTDKLQEKALGMIKENKFNAGHIAEDESVDGTKKYYVPVLEGVKIRAFDTLAEAQADLADRWAVSHPSSKKLREEVDKASEAAHGVPDAPFKTSWPELAFKRALMWAVEKGYDKVAWTTGEQQAERYDLSKEINSIGYEKRGKLFNVTVWDKNDKQVLNNQSADAAWVEENLGKEIADKMLQGTGRKDGKHTYLEDLDLKVGGEGMQGFYDKILPSTVNKLVKKWGGKVGETTIKSVPHSPASDIKTVHSLDITPAMRESIGKGLPLFQEEGAQRGSFNPDTNTIALLKNADLSTFLHESGHFFLETMNKLALDPNAPEGIKQDMQATFDWLGVKDLAEWNSHDLEWQREKHEQFARGFEAYLFEGKSPSLEMRGVFQRFRAWLLNVYRHLRALNVELTDEVRGVFDRMLATNDQIKETELARSFEPMFKDAVSAGMNEQEWREYQELGLQATQNATADLEARSLRDMKWLSNAKSRALKDLQREAAGRRREVREQVTKEIMAEPVNQARRFLTRGEFDIPAEANQALKRQFLETGMGSHKLSLPDLKEMYGEEANAIWRYFNTGKYGEVGTEGIHPDTAAEMFGFSSGDELVRALLSAENPRDRIAALTDQRMLEKYGDLTNPEVMAQAADEAVHNEARTRFVAAEMNALQRAVGGRKILAEAAKRFANSMIDRLRVRDIQPGRYSAAESRAARAADKAMKKGNLTEAAVEKRNQLIQNYASRAAHAGLAEVDKALRYFKKFDREGSRENIDTTYLDQIDALLERFDLRKGQSLKAIDKRKSMLAWKNSQEELGIEPEIPQYLLDEAVRKHYKDMTLEEMRGLRDTVKQIEHLGRLKNRLLTTKDERDFKTTVDAMVASINENAGGRVVDNRTRANKRGEVARLFKGFVASHRKISSLARELDGVKDGGVVWNTLIRTMNESGDKEAGMREKATKDLAKLIKPLLKDGGPMGGKGRFFKEIGKSLNREERIGIALNTGNLGNMQRLLDGEGWTLDQIRPVLDSLTKPEWDFVQSVWDFFETFRPEIGAKEKRVYGKQPDWIDPNPVQTPYGEYRGGYYPIKYDTRRSIAAEQHSDAEFAKQQMKGAYTSATTRRSFTKSRAEEVKGRPLLYAMDGLYTGVNEIIHDLSWHEWLIDANRLLRNKALDGAIRNGYGADVVRQFKSAVQDIAGGEMPTGTSFEKGIADLRAGAVVAGLGVNIVNAIINTTGITNSIVRVGPRWIAQGVGKFTAAPRETVAEVHEKSAMMRLRSKTMLREINEIQSQVRGKTRVRAVMDNVMFAPMTMTQMAVDMPTWWGAYQKALTAGENEDRAVSMADQAVLDSQSGGQVKDLAAIQRGGALQKLFTTFYGYFNASYNLGVERTKATNFKDPISVMKLGGDYLMLYTVPAVIGGLIKTALTGKDDDWQPEKLAKNLINEQVSYLMGLMVGLREVTGAVQTVAGVNPYTSSYGGPAGLRFFQEFFNLATQIHQGEADEALRKSAINVLGIFFKLPASQINRTIGGVEALIDGETENPAALVAGPPKK